MTNSELKQRAINKFPDYPIEVFEKAMKYISDRKPLHETEKEKDKRIKEVYEYVHWDSKMNA